MLKHLYQDQAPPSVRRGVVVSTAGAAGLALLLSIAGLAGIWSAVLGLWSLWTTDALKSIGMIVPVVSLLLVLRVWRSLAWQMEGTWWGLVILLGTAALVQFRERAILLLVLGPEWSLSFPPYSLVMFAYGSGLVLLFGGTRLFRAALFPLLLLLLVNPVPHVFNTYVDLPLQRASAHVARSFALALGQPLSSDKLRLMFTPEYGMFIAPGCNGIRGAVTMGLIALVAGYLSRFRLVAHALTVAGAILLGYVFNFVRLCVLVLYYMASLHNSWAQQRAEGADYVIGATLFFIAVYVLGLLIGRHGAPDGDVLRLPQALPTRRSLPHAASFFLRAGAMALFVLLGVVQIARAHASERELARRTGEELQAGGFPQAIGSFQLARTWNEVLPGGALLFHWADYAPAGGGTHVALGISPSLGSHDTLVCHTARGEDPLWRGQDTLATLRLPVSFSAALFNTGATELLEATTLCNGTSCGEYATPQTRFGLVYSRPTAASFVARSPDRPIPILIKVETTDTTRSVDQARAELTTSLSAFTAGVDLSALTQPYRHR